MAQSSSARRQEKYYDMFAKFLNPWLEPRDMRCKMYFTDSENLVLDFVDRYDHCEYLTFNVAELDEDFSWLKWRQVIRYTKSFLKLYLDTRRRLPPWIPMIG